MKQGNKNEFFFRAFGEEALAVVLEGSRLVVVHRLLVLLLGIGVSVVVVVVVVAEAARRRCRPAVGLSRGCRRVLRSDERVRGGRERSARGRVGGRPSARWRRRSSR